MEVAIIGGGIGGLTAAIALHRAGIRAQVYERADALEPAGSALTVWANAMQALGTLGLAEAVGQAGMVIGEGEVQTWRGERVTSLSLAKITFAQSVCLRRSRLQGVLLDALDPAALHLGCECTNVTSGQDGMANLTFSNGASATAEAVIGADGVHSLVRRCLHGDRPVRYAGYTAWRGIASEDGLGLVPDKALEAWGRGRRFGLVPVGQGHFYWFFAANMPQGAVEANGEVHRDEVLDRMTGWHGLFKEVVRTTPEEELIRTPIYDLPPLRRWGHGNVTLLGDAAHPMTPNLGQGACQAIEDAVTLAHCLHESGGIQPAFRRYEKLRQARASTIVGLSRRLGSIAQWDNPIACWLRDTGARLTPAWLTARQLRKVLTFEER